MVDRFNMKIIYVPYTNKHESQIGEEWEHRNKKQSFDERGPGAFGLGLLWK